MNKVQIKYKYAVIATDVAIFTVQNNNLYLLLIKMKKKPYKGLWALPGGLVGSKESIDKAAFRHLNIKTGVKDAYLEQLYTFGKVSRDPFGRVVSVAYMALIPSDGLKLKTTDEYLDVKWYKVKNLPKLAYDHREIVDYAILRLKAKLEYSNVVYSLLPDEFTLSNLQEVYEIILDKELDKRNFRKKILALGILQDIKKKKGGSPSRPANLYSFALKGPKAVKIL